MIARCSVFFQVLCNSVPGHERKHIIFIVCKELSGQLPSKTRLRAKEAGLWTSSAGRNVTLHKAVSQWQNRRLQHEHRTSDSTSGARDRSNGVGRFRCRVLAPVGEGTASTVERSRACDQRRNTSRCCGEPGSQRATSKSRHDASICSARCGCGCASCIPGHRPLHQRWIRVMLPHHWDRPRVFRRTCSRGLSE